MEPFPMSIEERIARGLMRLDCNGIQVTHHSGGKITLACNDIHVNERALAIATCNRSDNDSARCHRS